MTWLLQKWMVLENRVCLWEDSARIFHLMFFVQKIMPINFVDTCYDGWAVNLGQNGNFVFKLKLFLYWQYNQIVKAYLMRTPDRIISFDLDLAFNFLSINNLDTKPETIFAKTFANFR